MIQGRGVTSYLVCPLCQNIIGSSALGVRGHVNGHIRRGEVSETDKRDFEERIYDEGRVNRGKKDWIDAEVA